MSSHQMALSLVERPGTWYSTKIKLFEVFHKLSETVSVKKVLSRLHVELDLGVPSSAKHCGLAISGVMATSTKYAVIAKSAAELSSLRNKFD